MDTSYSKLDLMDIIDEKNEEIRELKKQLHNIQRSKLRLKNKLNIKIEELELRLNSIQWAEEWDNIETNNVEK